MNTIVISLGGSVVTSGGLDVEFIIRFRDLILKYSKENRFVIVVGGGKVSREYVDAARSIGGLSEEDQDWVGIMGTRLNAELIRASFGKDAFHKVIVDTSSKSICAGLENSKIIIAAGTKPGWSTDNVSVLLAKAVGAKKIINLSNIDYVYDKNPKTSPDAKKIENIGWDSFLKMVGERWSPGLSLPFDPVASKECRKNSIKVLVMNGKDLENVESCLLGRKFKGTIIG